MVREHALGQHEYLMSHKLCQSPYAGKLEILSRAHNEGAAGETFLAFRRTA